MLAIHIFTVCPVFGRVASGTSGRAPHCRAVGLKASSDQQVEVKTIEPVYSCVLQLDNTKGVCSPRDKKEKAEVIQQ
jgi:hypothetical protein